MHAQEAYRALLESLGLDVIVAATGDEFVSRCLTREQGQPLPDVLVVDVSAADPAELDTVEDLQRQLHAAIPIVGLVSPAGREDVAQRCLELGIEPHVTKPVKRKELAATIQAVLSSAVQHTSGAVDGELGPAECRLQILVADDSLVNQEVAAGLLTLQGHQVSTADSGRQAIEAWRKQHFDVILMDVEMHDLDGLEATAAIRAEEAGTNRRTPIIAMTAHAGEGFKERCLAGGMDGYVSKPFQPEELFQTLEKLCATRPAEPAAQLN